MIGIDVKLANTIQLLAGPIPINFGAGGATLVYTVPAGKTLLSLRVSLVEATGTPVTQATVSIDKSAPGDLFAAQPLLGFLAPNDKWTFDDFEKGLIVPAGGTVSVNVQTPASAAQTGNAFLFGKLI